MKAYFCSKQVACNDIFPGPAIVTITVRELKASLSQVLARAQAGDVIEVTSHKRPIARIVGIPAQAGVGLRGLLAAGGLSWTGGKPRFVRPKELGARGTPLSRMVLEDRG